jgi:hypothetical protein
MAKQAAHMTKAARTTDQARTQVNVLCSAWNNQTTMSGPEGPRSSVMLVSGTRCMVGWGSMTQAIASNYLLCHIQASMVHNAPPLKGTQGEAVENCSHKAEKQELRMLEVWAGGEALMFLKLWFSFAFPSCFSC